MEMAAPRRAAASSAEDGGACSLVPRPVMLSFFVPPKTKTSSESVRLCK